MNTAKPKCEKGITERKGPRGTSYLLKYDGGKDPATGKRRQLYKTVRGTKKEAERELGRLAHDGVAGGECAHHGQEEQVHGIVPRRDHEHHAQRLPVYRCATGPLRERQGQRCL